MSHEWDRGVLSHASWHGLEDLGILLTAEDLITAGEDSGAWPTKVYQEDLQTTSGLLAPLRGIVADYKAHDSRVLGGVGGRFRATTPAEWRDLVTAATKAGAKPTGAFSLRDGSRVLATFEVGEGNGLKNHLVLADAFDGSMKLTGGFTSVRVVCANTLSAAMSADSDGMAKLRHTASLEHKIVALGESLEKAIESGQAVRELYSQAEQTVLHRDDAMELLYKLFPDPEVKEDGKTAKSAITRAKNKRAEAMLAAAMPINRVGDRGTVATLWNAATYLVDRRTDGTFRKVRGGDRLDSMLFGTRANRIAEIEQVMIQVLRPDGSEESLSVSQAVDAGVETSQIGSGIIDDILNGN